MEAKVEIASQINARTGGLATFQIAESANRLERFEIGKEKYLLREGLICPGSRSYTAG